MDDELIEVRIQSDEDYPVYSIVQSELDGDSGDICLLSPAVIERIKNAGREYYACQGIMAEAVGAASDLWVRRFRGDPTAFTEEERAQWPKRQAEQEERKQKAKQAMADLRSKQAARVDPP